MQSGRAPFGVVSLKQSCVAFGKKDSWRCRTHLYVLGGIRRCSSKGVFRRSRHRSSWDWQSRQVLAAMLRDDEVEVRNMVASLSEHSRNRAMELTMEAFAREGKKYEMKKYFAIMESLSVRVSPAVRNAIVLSRVHDAQDVRALESELRLCTDEGFPLNGMTFTLLLNHFRKIDRMEEVQWLFRRARKAKAINVGLFNAYMAACENRGDYVGVLDTFSDLINAGLEPDRTSYGHAVSAVHRDFNPIKFKIFQAKITTGIIDPLPDTNMNDCLHELDDSTFSAYDSTRSISSNKVGKSSNKKECPRNWRQIDIGLILEQEEGWRLLHIVMSIPLFHEAADEIIRKYCERLSAALYNLDRPRFLSFSSGILHAGIRLSVDLCNRILRLRSAEDNIHQCKLLFQCMLTAKVQPNITSFEIFGDVLLRMRKYKQLVRLGAICQEQGLELSDDFLVFLMEAFGQVENRTAAFRCFAKLESKGYRFRSSAPFYPLLKSFFRRTPDTRMIELLLTKMEKLNVPLSQNVYDILVRGNAATGNLQEMERWYQEMTAKGEFSYETSLHLLKAQTLHGNIERGWDVAKETPRTINEAIEMSMHLYGYAGDVEGAIQQLRKLDDRALYIPALLDSIIDIENIEGAMLVMDFMKLERMSLSKEQAHILLRACATAMDRDKIYRVRAFMTQDGTALTPQDEQLIDEAIMETYVRTGDSESAMQLFNSYIEAKKPISSSLYVLAMTVCNRVLRFRSTINVFERMRRQGVHPSRYAWRQYIRALSADPSNWPAVDYLLRHGEEGFTLSEFVAFPLFYAYMIHDKLTPSLELYALLRSRNVNLTETTVNLLLKIQAKRKDSEGIRDILEKAETSFISLSSRSLLQTLKSLSNVEADDLTISLVFKYFISARIYPCTESVKVLQETYIQTGSFRVLAVSRQAESLCVEKLQRSTSRPQIVY